MKTKTKAKRPARLRDSQKATVARHWRLALWLAGRLRRACPPLDEGEALSMASVALCRAVATRLRKRLAGGRRYRLSTLVAVQGRSILSEWRSYRAAARRAGAGGDVSLELLYVGARGTDARAEPDLLADPRQPEPWALASRAEDAAGVDALLARLTPREREAVRRYHIDGLTHREAAGELGVNWQAVQQAVYRAGRRLRGEAPPVFNVRASRYSADDDDAILRLRAEGRTWPEVGRAVGVSGSAAQGRHARLLAAGKGGGSRAV